MSASNSLRKAADLQEIRNVLSLHSRGIDRADVGMLTSAYHDGGTVDYRFFAGPAADFAEMLIAGQKAGPVTMHRTAQMAVDLGGDEASSESYVMAYACDGTMQRLICGRYLDRLARREGRWRLVHRTYVLDTNMNWEGAFEAGPLGPLGHHVPVGGHGVQDAGTALLALAKASNQAKSRGSDAMTNTRSDAALLDDVVSRQQIADLTMAYCRGVDRADQELLASIFHDDSTVISGAFNGNGKDFASEICGVVEQAFEQTFHSIANQWIEIEGHGAVGETYVIAASTSRDTGEGSTDTLTGGRYIDRFERRGGAWKIAERSFVLDWTRSEPSTRQMNEGMYAALDLHGTRGKDDPVYTMARG